MGTRQKLGAGGRPPRRKRLATREGTVVTSVALPEVLHRRATLAALDRGWALTELYRTAIAEWLDRHASRRQP